MSETGRESLRRVFTEVFSARDISEPIVSFDSVTPAASARTKMDEDDFDVVAVRESGLVVGYLDRATLGDGCCQDHVIDFNDDEIILDSASLSEVVLGLSSSPRLFVKILGSVGGIVTKSDLQKPAVRMWLFGMVTLLEMRFTRTIDQFFPQESWRTSLSESRIQKAESLRAERLRRKQRVALLDCIQFSDKGTIFARNEELRQRTQFESRRQVEQAFKELERLRNNLAHSQDIISGDWDIIVRLVENLDRVIRGPDSPGIDD